MTYDEWKLLEAWRDDDEEWRIPNSPLGWAVAHLVDEALEAGERP